MSAQHFAEPVISILPYPFRLHFGIPDRYAFQAVRIGLKWNFKIGTDIFERFNLYAIWQQSDLQQGHFWKFTEC